jgi:hypothetical protein
MGATREAVLYEIERMSEKQLEVVLGSIRPNAPLTGSEFAARFGGLIPPDELDRMDAAIERDCETVEPDHAE